MLHQKQRIRRAYFEETMRMYLVFRSFFCVPSFSVILFWRLCDQIFSMHIKRDAIKENVTHRAKEREEQRERVGSNENINMCMGIWNCMVASVCARANKIECLYNGLSKYQRNVVQQFHCSWILSFPEMMKKQNSPCFLMEQRYESEKLDANFIYFSWCMNEMLLRLCVKGNSSRVIDKHKIQGSDTSTLLMETYYCKYIHQFEIHWATK